jgi:hypothetical protein
LAVQVQEAQIPHRVSPRYTARHRHYLPGWGYTSWSEGVPDGRHGHTLETAKAPGFIADSVGSPVHRHAWSVETPRRTEHGYSSGPLVPGTVAPPINWLTRVLRRSG